MTLKDCISRLTISGKFYLKGNPEAEFAVRSDALVVRKFPVVVQQLTADDLWLAVDQEFVDGLENAVSFGFTEKDRKQLNRKWKLWSSGRALGSQSEGCGFDPRPMLDGSGVKAMPGSIPTPNSGSL